ncbi:hypothetical protein [Kineococcus radiotolerans]|uniref:hypothetical protein n=1 Tax=Kineococcus radiotolerans TaxID=131568 RepID=UPI00059C25C3|nr:hypothetical protein [Kineococcus radiotolerans]
MTSRWPSSRPIDCPLIDCPLIDCPLIDCPLIDCPLIDCPLIDCPLIDCPPIDRLCDGWAGYGQANEGEKFPRVDVAVTRWRAIDCGGNRRLTIGSC